MKCPKCNGKCVRIRGWYSLSEVIKPGFNKIKQWRCKRCLYQFREGEEHSGFIDIIKLKKKRRK